VPGGRSWIAILLFTAGCGDRQPPAPPEAPRDDGLHNVLPVGDGLFSGSSPEGDAGFDSLQSHGIRTIISVDGAPPDVAAARARGMRYVHIPVGYGGITRDQAVLLCKAATDLPGPIYVHCHHGKHRGPAACTLIRLARGGWAAADAVAFLKAAGTDPRYEGLYANARDFPTPTEAELRTCPSNFPERVDVGGLAARMVEIDELWDRIRTKPAVTDVVQLIEQYRECARLSETSKMPFPHAEAAARDLERALRTPDDASWKAAINRSAGLCTKCHHDFRDRPHR
jgi:protein tyrosine phosphatase (PTP) superfamily phosphohydrolase (DUF442 family)